MIVLVGASASGKTELANVLYNMYGYQKCVTTTTRSHRAHESDGIDYHFLTQQAFKEKIKENAFIEVTTYQNHYYGLQKKDVKPKGIIILDPNGANALVKEMKALVFVCFVWCDEDIRSYRMANRGDHPKDIQKRIKEDREIFKKEHLLKIDLMINNNSKSIEEQATFLHHAYQNYIKHKDVSPTNP